jgi:hypothetical protein
MEIVMQLLEIGPDTGNSSSEERTLYEEFLSAAKLDVRVFSTWCNAGNNFEDVEYFEFVTTSKELHLGLGKLGENGRINLGLVLEHWFRKHPLEEVLFRVRVPNDEEGRFRGAMLVSRMTSSDHVTFHCSPVH